MSRIVVKFGGTSVADTDRIERAADKVLAEREKGNEVAVVVSAMAGVTNQLVDYCQKIDPGCDPTEYDTVVASGEQVTSGLMVLALHKRGLDSRSYMGWQIPLVCDEAHGRARIRKIGPENLSKSLDNGTVPVIAGFQGITSQGRIATLGRGGSDTTAVALAAALKADRCDIYTDVNGVYTTDPRIVSNARRMKHVTYEEMLEMAAQGAKVLHPRSVELALAKNMPLQVLSTFEDKVGSDLPGTLIVREDDIMEKQIISGVTYKKDEAKVTILRVPDMPGVAAAVFTPIAEAGINVDVIVQNVSPDGKATDMTFTVPKGDAEKTRDVLQNLDILKDCEVRVATDIAKVSIVGIGMASHPGIAQTMFSTLAKNKINILAITTSEIKISVLVEEKYTELAVRELHSAFELEKDPVYE